MKIQNLFAKGIINKDLDSRFVDSNEMIDAENFFVATVESSSVGVGRNALGNTLKTSYNISGGKTVGHGIDISSNFVYDLIKGTYYDYIIEYNSITHSSTIVCQSTTGTRLNFIEGERVLNVDVIVTGTQYDVTTQQGGNLLAISGDSNPPRIFNINRSKTWGVDGFTAEEIMLIKAPPLNPLIVVPFTTSGENGEVENFLKDKFISFTYRYKYKDGYYSAIATWKDYSFDPSPFKFNFITMENDGMINIYNACNLSFNSGPREVVAIDLLFKKSNENKIYKIDQFVKSEEGWGDDIVAGPIKFSNSKIYSILPESEYFRSFDNVPENETAATIAGNRKMGANYREGKNLIDKNGNKVVMDYSVGYTSVPNEEDEAPVSKLDTNPQTIIPTPTVPFVTSLVEDGKIRIDFSGYNLVKNSSISMFFNIETTPTVPVITRDTTKFVSNYFFILTQDYSNIADLVSDTANGFKTNLETNGYFSDLAKNAIILPTDSLSIPPSYYHGFTLTVVSPNVIDISLPIMKYEIEVLPSGPNTYLEEFYYDKSTQVVLNSVGSKKSMKSYRSYEVCMIYRDLQGRKTTDLTSENSTVFIPIVNSINQNKLTVTIPITQKPPTWATSYKFAVKQNKGFYNTIYCTTFYVDGQFVWIKLQGASINKVKEGDTLLVKRDVENDYISIPVTTKVLEIKNQEKDFITGNVDKYGQQISEESGLYMKIKPEGFQIRYIGDEFTNYPFDDSSHEVPIVTITIPTTIPTSLPAGSVVTFSIHSAYRSDQEVNDFNQTFIASSEYANFGEFYDAQLASVAFQGTNTGVRDGGVFQKSATSDSITIRGTSAGTGRYNAFLNGQISIRSLSGIVIFESIPDDVDDGIFYETPDLFNIIDGEHVWNGPSVVDGVHTLDKTFNCFVQGNGAESNQILDSFNKPYINIDFCPTAISEDEYKQVNRFSDITYSGIFNANTNVNKLNEFNLSLANFKDDIEKSYGPIYKIKGQDTNLEVYQQDKDSIVYYGKDILYNADGTSNLASIEDVLGQQQTYKGEYGISTHPDSYADYGYNTYHTDVKRGVVIKKSNNGLFEISSQGMKDYFKKLFRDNVIKYINGKYDQFNDVYVLHIQYGEGEYVTWVYSDKDNGWLGRMTFEPEDMCCINGKFLSFKNGEIYEHNQLTERNTFYGVESPSNFTFNFSQEPSERKNYKTIEIEGTDSWNIELETDLDKGYINAVDFDKQEGVFRAYTRTSNEDIDTSLLSCQGIGICTISGLILSFTFKLDDSISIGDKIINSDLELVGTITNKTNNSLTLNTVSNIVNGDFVLCSKDQSSESPSLLGYHMVVKASLSKNTKTEIYAINSETSKSFS